MNRVKISMAKPMSSSTPITSHGEAPGHQDGDERAGVEDQAVADRAVGMESSSFFSAKYEAKKMQSRILAISIGWNWTAPEVDPEPGPVDCGRCGRSGASSRMPPTKSSR